MQIHKDFIKVLLSKREGCLLDMLVGEGSLNLDKNSVSNQIKLIDQVLYTIYYLEKNDYIETRKHPNSTHAFGGLFNGGLTNESADEDYLVNSLVYYSREFGDGLLNLHIKSKPGLLFFVSQNYLSDSQIKDRNNLLTGVSIAILSSFGTAFFTWILPEKSIVFLMNIFN